MLKDKPKRSKSKVLRDVLFRMWEKGDSGYATQDEHYDAYMDKLIQHFKGKI